MSDRDGSCRNQSAESIEASPASPFPSLATLIVLAAGFRLTAFFIVRYGGSAPDFSDFLYYHDLARLSAEGYLPGIQYWTEYPPVFPWLAVAIYRLIATWPAWSQPYFWFDLALTVVLMAADAGTILAIDRIGRALWGKASGRRSAILYAALFAPTYAILGWFDSLPTFFLLAALALIVAPVAGPTALPDLRRQPAPGRWFGAGLLAGVGLMTKLFPVIVLPAAFVVSQAKRSSFGVESEKASRWRLVALPIGLTLVGVASAVVGLSIPFLLTSPPTFLATFRNVLSRGSWESPWALLDGYYGTGVVAALSDRLFFNESASWGQADRYPIVWFVVAALTAAIYVHRLRAAARVGTAGAAVALTAFGVTLLLLLSRGFSQQFVVWILPFVVLVLPDAAGATLAVLLTFDTLVLEGYFFVHLFPSLHQLLWVSVAVRTALLIWFAVECATSVDPDGRRQYLRFRRHLVAPAALLGTAAIAVGLLTLGPETLAQAQTTFGDPALESALATAPAAADVLFTQPTVYDRLVSQVGGRPTVLAAEPRLLEWTGDRSLTREFARDVGDAPNVVTVTDTSQPTSGPLVDAIGRWLAARYGAPTTRDLGQIHLASYGTANRPREKPLDLTFGPNLRLIGARPDVFAARAGSALTLTLDWTTSTRVGVDYSVSTQILDPNGRLVTQHDGMPVDNTMPTSVWNPGEAIDDSIAVPIPPSTPPGSYTIIVAVYNHQTLARLPVGGSTAQGDHGVVGNVMITS